MNTAPSRRLVLLALASATLFTAGCESMHRSAKPGPLPATFTPTPVATQAQLDPTLLQRSSSEYKLGPGDVLQIEIIGDLTTRTKATVGPDGKVYFNLLPGIDVWGMTLTQARERMVQEMQRYVREAQPIALNLVRAESQRIWVLGRLNKPGVYGLNGPMTLLEAISEAGGPASLGNMPGTAARVNPLATRNREADDAADLSRSFVIRQGRMIPVDFQKLLREGDMSQNIYLQPDDFIYLPSGRAGSIHVLGAVAAPRAIEYTSQLTVLQSVALAGGTVPKEAYLSHVAIVRGSLTQPQVAVVDFNAILHGQAPDIALEPQDIVYVPHSPYRVLNRYVDLILDTFVRTVGVNEGARAVSDRATTLGVTVPLGPL